MWPKRAQQGDSSSVAKALKRIQDAIGEWHDWLCLGEEAKAALGQDAPELTAALQARDRAPFCSGVEDHAKHARPAVGRVDGVPNQPAKRPPAAVALSDRRLASSQRSA